MNSWGREPASNIIEYLSDIGEDMSFLHLMLKAPASQITLLSNEDAVVYGIHVMDERTERIINWPASGAHRSAIALRRQHFVKVSKTDNDHDQAASSAKSDP